MAITTERLPRSRVAVEIEVDDERVEASMNQAVRRLSKQLKIPGFRPGKAPRKVVERHIGRPALLQEALDELIPNVIDEAIKSEQIEPIGQPELELKSMEPLVVSATVPVRPEVDLKDYEAIRVPRPEIGDSDEQVERSLLETRRRFATLEPVDRAIEWGDTVRADVTVQVAGQGEPHEEEDAEFAVREDAVVSLPGFLERLIGLERGGPYDLEFALPDDFNAEELAGKQASYTVTINEVKQEILPDLDDEFVKSLDEQDLETVEQLRARIAEEVNTRAEAEAKSSYHDEIVDLLVARAEIDYPEIIVEHEIDRQIDQQSNHASHTQEGLDAWLGAIGKTEEEIRDDLRESADQSVRRALVLGELTEAEEIVIGDEQVDAEIERMASQLGTPGESSEQQLQQVRQLFDTPESRSSIQSQLVTRAALDRLEEIASQADGDEGATSPRRTSRRRRGAAARAEEAGAEQAGEAADEPSSEPSGETESASDDAEQDE